MILTTIEQLATIEQCRKLRKLGVKGNTLAAYIYYKNTEKYHVNSMQAAEKFQARNKEKFGEECLSELIPAYNVAELLTLIGKDVSIEMGVPFSVEIDAVNSQGLTIAEALGNMLLYLLNKK